jgi:predicted AAA+ superfamily ATPase
MEGWKNYLKGVYDTKPDSVSFLVTGSARLETFRQSGDSLAGRYFLHRLLPIAPSEARWAGEKKPLDHFLERGGFPEPFLSDSAPEAGLWRRQYLDSLIREDILTFENILQLKTMNLLVELLRKRVASPLSYQSLSEDLKVSPNTVKHYLEILEALYIVFRIYPYHKSISRSLLQQPKVYFFDCGLVDGDPGKRLENLIAVSVLKELCMREDRDGKKRNLSYLRTKDGKEVDFVIIEAEEVKLMLEVKSSDREISDGLRYFNGRYAFAGTQLVGELRLETNNGQLSVRRALDWLENIDQEF